MTKFLRRFVRCIPAIPGKLRLARLLMPHLHGRAHVTDRFGFCYEVPNINEPIGFHLLANGVYEPSIHKLLLRTLRPGGVFIDVGANIGTFTIPAAALVGSSGNVVAIEASPEIFQTLKRNIAANGISNVELVCAAAGTSIGEVDFYPAPVDHFGMGSRAAQFGSAPISVSCVTIDWLMERLGLSSVDVIKIDVEGFELDVLKGARGLINGESPPLIVFEFCDWAEARVSQEHVGAAQRFLMEHGYKIWRASDYERSSAMSEPVTTGTDMLVARR